jgi:3-carboxy-cis,cis-muconate cycloisomerase
MLSAGVLDSATPVIALVDALRSAAPEPARGAVHVGATSQDIIDTAFSWQAQRAISAISADAIEVSGHLAVMASGHRKTPAIARSMLQHGEPTVFGALPAARLVAVDEALIGLATAGRERLAVQLGGAVGTLARAGDSGSAFVAAFAARLGLAAPAAPWHTSRGRVITVASAMATLAGELAAAAQDVVLLSLSEIGEVSVARPGGSSAMAHKRNPASAMLALAAFERIPGAMATLFAAMPQELHRSPGRWQGEWGALQSVWRLCAAVARHTAGALDGLIVHRGQIDQNLAAFLSATGHNLALGPAVAMVDRALVFHEEVRGSFTPAGTVDQQEGKK